MAQAMMAHRQQGAVLGDALALAALDAFFQGLDRLSKTAGATLGWSQRVQDRALLIRWNGLEGRLGSPHGLSEVAGFASPNQADPRDAVPGEGIHGVSGAFEQGRRRPAIPLEISGCQQAKHVAIANVEIFRAPFDVPSEDLRRLGPLASLEKSLKSLGVLQRLDPPLESQLSFPRQRVQLGQALGWQRRCIQEREGRLKHSPQNSLSRSVDCEAKDGRRHGEKRSGVQSRVSQIVSAPRPLVSNRLPSGV